MNSEFYDFHTHNAEPVSEVVKMVNLEPGDPAPELDGIFYSCGIHPWQTEELFDLALLAEMLPSLTAIGETGLDRLRGAPLSRQIEIFEQHLSYPLPLIIHNVRCTAEILHRLPNPTQTLWHRAPTKSSTLQQIIATGSTVSFGQNGFRYLDPNVVPLNRLGLESDDSDLPIAEVYKSAAELWQISIEQLKKQLKINFTNLFLNS